MNLSEISAETGLSKPSVLRFLHALMLHGYVDVDPQTKRYRPGYEAFRVGSLVGVWGIRPMALRVMRKLTDQVGFSTVVSALNGRRMVVLATVEGRGPLRYAIPNGNQLTLHGTAAGQAALSTLSDIKVMELLKDEVFAHATPSAPKDIPELIDRVHQIRKDGYATSWEMVSPGVGSVSAPAIGADGRLAAVLTLGFGTGQVDRADCTTLGKMIQAAAAELTLALKSSASLHPADQATED